MREMAPGLLLLLLLPHVVALLSRFSYVASLDLPSRELIMCGGSDCTRCYWTQSCQSKWLGGCSAGHVITAQSDDCSGLCGGPSDPPCLPFHTHFHCCKPERPRITDRCLTCNNKVSFDDEYVCCMDCSEPYFIDKNSKLGYCKTGAELAVQLKPQETFKWVAGPWMKCSSPCDGGVRYRDVGCFGSMEAMPSKQYPVDDSRCSGEEMPAQQEPCNMMSCGETADSDLDNSNDSGMSGWLVTLFILLGLVTIGGFGIAGYTLYRRRTSTPSGFVYIMLEGYS